MDPNQYILNLRVLGIIFSTFYIWPNVLKYIHIQTCGTCVRMYQPPLLSGHSSPVGVSNLAEDGMAPSLSLPLFSPFTILSFSFPLPRSAPSRWDANERQPQLVCTSAALPTSARRERLYQAPCLISTPSSLTRLIGKLIFFSRRNPTTNNNLDSS